jgi:hypothetical protein
MMIKFLRTCAVLSFLLYFVSILSCGSGKRGVPDNPSPASSAKAITAFSFTSPAAIGVINESAKTISVILPYGANVTALVATFTTTGAGVKVGPTIQVSGRVSNDFTNDVAYTVTADDGTTATYIVTVTVLAPLGYTNPATIDATSITDTAAILLGSFNNSSGYTTAVWFEYGATMSYGYTTMKTTYAAVGTNTISVQISGLSSKTAYHFRIVTQNSGGIFSGNDITFTTSSQMTDPLTFLRKFICTFDHHNWTSSQIFMENDLAVYPTDGVGILYRSRQNNNSNLPPPDNPDWWIVDGSNGNLAWFTPVIPRNQWYWAGGASAVGVAAWSYSVVSPDHWSEEETEGGTMNPEGLGPAVRVEPKTDTMYHLSLEYSGDDNQGHAWSYVRLYKRVNGVSTLLYTFGEFVTWPSTASKLAVYGSPPVLSAALRHNGYDPFEGDIVSNPWQTIGTYTDTSPSAILEGQPGLWNPYPVAEGTSHWSYGAPN